ncbi:hypothetical protein RQP46_002371 [Phenoliferia psychrophenolica]
MHEELLFLLGLIPLLAGASPVPAPTPMPAFGRRNGVDPPSTYTTSGVNPASRTSIVAAAASASQSSTDAQNLFSGGIPSQLLDWVAVVIVGGVFTTLLLARYFFIKRYYPAGTGTSVSIRAYFLPKSGIHIPWLRIHINAPPRPDISPFVGGVVPRTRRRDVPTVGPGIGEGGRRNGPRDEDDQVDGDAEELGEMRRADEEHLPGYAVDVSLPAYAKDESANRARANAVPAAGTPATVENVTTDPEDEAEAVLSVQAYEEATRVSRLIGQMRSEQPRPESSGSVATTDTAATKVDLEGEGGEAKKGKDIETEADIGEATIEEEMVEDPLGAAQEGRGKGRESG